MAMDVNLPDAPEGVPQYFADAWNDRDARRLAALFAEDAEFVNVVGLWWHRREDIYRAHDYGLRTIFSESTLRVRRTKVKPLSPTIAVVHARMHLSGQSAHAGVAQPGNRVTVFSFVVTLGQEGWRCVSAQNTDVVPGAETHLVDEQGQMHSADYRKGG